MNKNLITRDASFESLLDECYQIESLMKNMISYAEYLERSIEGIAYFSGGIGTAIPRLFDKSEAHREVISDISEAHRSCEYAHKESVSLTQIQQLQSISQESMSWFRFFEEVRVIEKSRKSTRLVYDHYVQKVEQLRAAVQRKKERNSNYHESPKIAERIYRVIDR